MIEGAETAPPRNGDNGATDDRGNETPRTWSKEDGSETFGLELQSLDVKPSRKSTFNLDYIEEETSCGIGNFKPAYLQSFATPKSFLVVSCVIGILQGAFFTYFIGVLSTLEKRFSFDSKVSAIILLADNLSPVFTGSCLGYYGGRSNRPRLISLGMLVVVLSCFLSALPYFIYGPSDHLLVEGDGGPNRLCPVGNAQGSDCEKDRGATVTFPAVALLFVAYLCNGFGSTAFYTLGTPYIDDNVKKKESPIYFGIMYALRILGPTLGFLLAAVCLKYNEDPFSDPGIANDDPRFIGAWWIGFAVLGVLIFVFSLPLFLFPKSLKKTPGMSPAAKQKERKGVAATSKELWETLTRLFKNPILICSVCSSICTLIGILGYFVFMPKYVENQFRFSASQANFVTGSTTSLAMVLGMFTGALLIRRCKPSPRVMTFCMLIVGLVSATGMFVTMFFKCDQINLPGAKESVEFKIELTNNCNAKCGCTTQVYHPVCAEDDFSTYFSPCFAGCKHYNTTRDESFYSSCSCVEDFSGSYNNNRRVYEGYCPVNCYMFIPFIIIFTLNKFVSSSSRIGSTLITLRCIKPEDKDFALGTITTLVSLLALIPYPIIFGALTDSACIVWESTCGVPGNCWIYDTDKLRYSLHGAASAFLFLGSFFDLAVFLMSGRVKNLYAEDDVETESDTSGKEEIKRFLSQIGAETAASKDEEKL